jgi:hypothetical protein
MLLNICETVPQCPYVSLVLNTSGSLYSLVKKNTRECSQIFSNQESLTSYTVLYGKYNKVSQLPSDEYSRSRDFPVVNTRGSHLQYKYKLLTKIQNLKTYRVISIATKPLGDLPDLLLDDESLYEKCLEIFSSNLII